jgi:16S rRNA (cytidine1402-2'-O)-methyltransferase
MSGKLYFVATPIGNLKDMSERAIETLNFCDEILCEDTRDSLKLLNYFKIKKPLVSFHKFNFKQETLKVLEKLKNGLNLALITDAGTPCISDPGSELIKDLIQNNIDYTIIPGATAFVNAFVLSGFSAPLTFVGFLPESKIDANKLLDELKFYKSTLAFYVSPHNLLKTLDALFKKLGNRKACSVRELTKLFEEKRFFNLGDEYEGKILGEFVILVEGNTSNNELNNLSVFEHFNYYLNLDYSKNDSIKQVAKDRGVAKSIIYNQIVNKK